QAVSPFARRHVEVGAKRLVEVREIVEAPAIGDLRNVQGLLIRIAECRAARLEPVFKHPVAECLTNLLEPQMQGPDRNTEIVGDELRRQLGVVKLLPAKSKR